MSILLGGGRRVGYVPSCDGGMFLRSETSSVLILVKIELGYHCAGGCAGCSSWVWLASEGGS
jgi:hypothetical protein